MDIHRPALYITAVSHRGLLDAAALAERLEHRDEAALWRTKAAALKAAWEQAFVPEPTQNDRTYISGLWPSWIAVSSRPRFLEGLEDRWSRARDVRGGFRERPPWTYFELAAAHQHLFLGKPERVWSTIRWFRENEASPDLYTWWEGADEGNSYDCWDRLRGWVKPPSSQPHYWTSAEMLLLQLDMLVHADLSGTEPAVVIGAGVPREWIERPLAARGVWTRLGRVDWEWRDGKARVVFHGKKRPVRLGPSFPARAPVRVERG
jgi:hypothetical protein